MILHYYTAISYSRTVLYLSIGAVLHSTVLRCGTPYVCMLSYFVRLCRLNYIRSAMLSIQLHLRLVLCNAKPHIALFLLKSSLHLIQQEPSSKACIFFLGDFLGAPPISHLQRLVCPLVQASRPASRATVSTQKKSERGAQTLFSIVRR